MALSSPQGVISSYRQPVEPGMIEVPYDVPARSTTARVRVFQTPKVEAPPAPAPADPVASELQTQAKSARNEKLLLAGAQFALDIFNASTQYKNVEGTTRFNILQSRNQAADALYRGRQAGLAAQSEGQDQSEDALLALVAQGQSADSAGVQRVVRSYQAIGEQNAALAESNAMREALGFELEQVGAQFQLDNARINRDSQYITSFLNFGARTAGALV